MKGYNLYWGEIHTHSTLGDGYESPKKLLAQAKSRLDFFSVLDHSQLPDGPHIKVIPGGYRMQYLDQAKDGYWYLIKHWKRYCRLANSYNEPGKFVTFIGHEWTSWNYGHWNVYFPSEKAELILAKTLDELVNKTAERNAIVIPHHPAYQPGIGINWETVKPSSAMPLVEIFSYHGSSENDYGPYPMDHARMGPRAEKGTIDSMLKLGLKLGFMASTDEHGHVAARYGLGITGVHAKRLDRASIWEALLSRRTVAATGDRIGVDFSLNGHPLGSELQCPKKAVLSYNVEAEDLIDRIEIIKNGRAISAQLVDVESGGSRSSRFKFRVAVGWNTIGNKMRCLVRLRLKGGEILSATPCVQSAPDFVIEECSRNTCSFRLTKEGIVPDSVVFCVRARGDSQILVNANDKKVVVKLKDLLTGSFAFDVKKVQHTTIKFFRAWREQQFCRKYTFTDKNPRPGDYYYLRVAQANGQMAWSSPIWLK